jgi:hypothetical protein
MSGDELMTDAELDAWLKKANNDLLASLREHIDVEAGLREVYRRAGLVAPPARRRVARRLRLLVRAYRWDALCGLAALAVLVWLALMAAGVDLGWPA